MTISIPQQLEPEFERKLHRNCQVAYAIRAITDILQCDSDGAMVDVSEARSGLHCALSILSEELKELADEALDLTSLEIYRKGGES